MLNPLFDFRLENFDSNSCASFGTKFQITGTKLAKVFVSLYTECKPCLGILGNCLGSYHRE